MDYGYNDQLSTGGNPNRTGLPLAWIKRPSEIMSYADVNSWGGLFRSWQSWNYALPIHNEGFNVSYVDGHVKWMRYDTWVAAGTGTVPNTFMVNN
jgi:prepilin-type processing-associated H-X9-DG protein